MENVRKHWNIKLITTEKEEISKITAYEFWYDYLIVLRMGRFGAAQGCLGLEGGRGAKEAPLPKFYHTLDSKYMNQVIHPLISTDISTFSTKIIIFCYIKKYRHKLHFDT